MDGNFQTATFAKPHFLIVIKNKFLKFQLVIFLEFETFAKLSVVITAQAVIHF